ncbi:MAG: hypothetical protein ACJ77N_04240 [Chloroflexota bacterium]
MGDGHSSGLPTDEEEEEELRRQIAFIGEQLARFAGRAATGYGTDEDRAYWLDLVASLRRRREQLSRELAESFSETPGRSTASDRAGRPTSADER